MSVHIVPHPLIHDALIQLRDVNTTTEEFRRIANRISVLLVAEALRDLPTERATAQTPLEKADEADLAACPKMANSPGFGDDAGSNISEP